ALVPSLVDHVTTRPVRMLLLASRSVAASWTVFPTVTAAGLGVTVTVATGAGATAETLTVAVPVLVSLVAVMVGEPAATPDTSPDVDTVALVPSLVDQVTTRPVRMLLLASRSVAVSWTVFPTITLAGLGVTVTVATGAGATAFTVTDAVPDLVSLVAVIVTDPAATPMTRPLELTCAFALSLLVQVTVRPVRTLFAASRNVAVSCTVLDTLTLVGVRCTVLNMSSPAGVGATVTVVTGTGLTLPSVVPVRPAHDALMVAATTG